MKKIKGLKSTESLTEQEFDQVFIKGKHPISEAQYPSWHPFTIVQFNIIQEEVNLLL